MGKWEPYSRRELRRRRLNYLKRNAVIVGAVMSAATVALALITWVIVGRFDGGAQWYLLGIAHASLTAAVLHLLNTSFLAFDREAVWHLRGAWGEDNTRSELRRAKLRRLVWGTVDSIQLAAGDLDHVVITRRGGVLAIDTKWRNDVDRDALADMARSAGKARLRAESLAHQLLRSERRARHRSHGKAIAVTPIVVLWGAAQQGVPAGGREIDGVMFLAGRELVPWLRTLQHDPVSKAYAHEALDALRGFRASAAVS